MRRLVPLFTVFAFAALAVGCSSSKQPEAQRSDVKAPAATSHVSLAGGPGPTSQVSVADDAPKSSVEVRVEQILSELHAAPSPEGTVITVPERVLFDFDRAEIKPEGAATLDKLVEVIRFYAAAPISIRGHTDSIGDPAYNEGLSQRRAAAVRDYFVSKHGIDGGRLKAVGFGARQPVAPNTKPDGSDNPDGRQRNRRVEIVLEGVRR
jgi:photosystem I P700 chlorophyll a apoprotein A2